MEFPRSSSDELVSRALDEHGLTVIQHRKTSDGISDFRVREGKVLPEHTNETDTYTYLMPNEAQVVISGIGKHTKRKIVLNQDGTPFVMPANPYHKLRLWKQGIKVGRLGMRQD